MRLARSSLLALCLALAALALRFWVAPLDSTLQKDYATRLNFAVADQFRSSAAEPWVSESFNAQRIDQSLSSLSEVNVVQSNLNWYNAGGELIFVSSGIYGVDRQTRANVAGYGDVARSEQFLLPPRVAAGTYSLWDSMYTGPRALVFERSEMLDRLPVYVFRFSASGLDETSGYSYLPLVPERYLAHTNCAGRMWVEPLSGIVVDYEEQGESYFVDPSNRIKLAAFHIWSDQYTPATRAAQLKIAQDARLRILLLESCLPAGLSLAAFFWLVFILRKRAEAA